MAKTFLIVGGDWVIDQATGRHIMIEEKPKTRQDFGELLSIETQRNGFGAGLVGLVGEVPENPLALSLSIMERVGEAVARWIGLQRKQRNILSPEETVTRLVANQAKTEEQDKTRVIFRAAILTQSGDEIARGGVITTVAEVR